MHVFLSEYLTCGALSETVAYDRSLAVEGAAMLRALAADAVQTHGWQVSVTWDAALEPIGVAGVIVHASASPDEERSRFPALTRDADATLVIAPEFDRILEDRCRLIVTSGGRSSGSSAEAVALCADKLLLARHLEEHDVPTVPTSRFDLRDRALNFDEASTQRVVIKPRFGAGSINTFVVSSRDGYLQAAEFDSITALSDAISQPFVQGRALSAAAIVSRSGIEVWPVCSQDIVGSERLHYAGGIVPADIDRSDEVADVARRAIATVPGLHGYVGIDLILPDDAAPVVVEINPRLTSSYLGYRRLAASNLAPRILQPDEPHSDPEWKPLMVAFQPGGSPRLH
ncbi:MAG: ATP-grasp domain-containing protein [Planctomycetaceae bacterium]|nr:ATP-grasp domain-containing protein [Planctomycetaceae bacterium]